MQVTLEVIKGPELGRVFAFKEPATFLVGRSKKAHFRFSEQDPYVSRQHFLLEIAPPRVYFRELMARNPTRINGLYKQEEELHDGDVIEVGYTQLKVAVSTQVEFRTIYCKDCGKAIQLFPAETLMADLLVCSDCYRRVQAALALSGELRGPLQVTCQCGTDLTEVANSDGRAHVLQGRVTYVCERCLPKRREGGVKQIGPYTVLKRLGEGGMGEVYLAWHPLTARLVAVKRMNVFDRRLAARFERETRLMRRATHEYVLRYIDSGQAGNQPYLAMEYASGGCLEDLLLDHPNGLPIRDALNYVINTLSGLGYVHRLGIVHRDIKPANILLQDAGKGLYLPRLADFGLAREYSKAGGSVLTQLGAALGTLLYMPPEQVRDAHNVREPADLYSIGVTLYRMLTGKYPFDFPTPADVVAFIAKNRERVQNDEQALKLMIQEGRLRPPQVIVLADPPIPILERKPELPDELASVVDRSIQKAAKARFQSAAEFEQGLQKLTGRI